MRATGAIILGMMGILFGGEGGARADDDQGAPNIGERLFLETRFAEFFFANSGGNANAVLTNGDPLMATTASIYGPLPGPFAGQSMNCRACHMVEEQESTGNRTYCDFARRSPVPDIGDGRRTTTRNAMPLVDSLLPHNSPLLLHNDAQFAAVDDLVIDTMTGRNYGWQPAEYATAIHHIATIIRTDDGTGGLAQQYGGFSYAQIFAEGSAVPPQYLIPAFYYMDLTIADTNDPNYVTDDAIVQSVADLIADYLETLVFSQDLLGNFNGSPFDVFLAKNGLPQQPDYNEAPLHYGRRLLRLAAGLSHPKWVSDPADGHFLTNAHGQVFQFGSNELAGLEIFLTDSANLQAATNLQQQGLTTGIEVGNCAACHTPPAFTDFLFHNNGAAQQEYDGLHGSGAFMNLAVPALSARQTNYDAWLPPTPNHPHASGVFETPPAAADPALADLGLWNVFANPDFPGPQTALAQILPQLLSVPSPTIGAGPPQAGGLVLTVTNGTPGATYFLLATTNLLVPLYDWAMVATNTLTATGQLSFTNALKPGVPAQFYALELAAIPPAFALPRTIALFKTPTVRDLVSSEPYLHTGQMDTLGDVLNFYETFSGLARAGAVRNADPQLGNIFLDSSAIAPLTAFLQALNEENYADIPCPCQQ